ncbi:GGDEF domain-containing protein [Motiliproteus sp. MSK22-1]|uniref:GGDEF domain-containing protein n=1 Tax=Motiliproteus sp. MSK22-1 TaxID=1897630 RepID=UPI000975686B|nr:GGDEF domain-containing protein [Motiliproteus sp. MSK22-1]OMH39582.1 hypothetical protein BGP75_03060 [Motiliproteus sp. MSK22-1]
MSSNNPESDDRHWKKRCLQLEHQQEILQVDGELLCRLLQRFCAVTNGIDQELDRQLEPLQETLKGFPPDKAFSPLARSLESGILQVLQRRDDGARFSHESMNQLLRQLASCVDDVEINDKLETLKAEIGEACDQYYEYPRLLNELARFQAQVLDKSQPEHVENLKVNGGDPHDKEALCRYIGDLLVKMLEQLSVPKEMLPKARQLMAQIEGGFDWGQLESILKEAVELAVKATATGHQDFETYLQGLNVQLDDIQSFLSESRDHRADALESSRLLDKSVRSDVAKVEFSLTESDNLDQLQKSVRAQLSNIVRVVDTYREEQVIRENKAEERLAHLQKQVVEMEQKAAIVQEHLEEQRLRALSDPLTGLPNRAAYDDSITMLRAESIAQNKPLTLVVADLDHFKAVNDGFGHLAGDKVLRLVAKILRGGLRESDVICRYGGEEFVIVMPNTDSSQALEVVEKLRRVMEQSPFNFKGKPVRVTMSFGIAQNLADEAPDGLFSRADRALYAAKEAGRNRCILAE